MIEKCDIKTITKKLKLTMNICYTSYVIERTKTWLHQPLYKYQK